MLLRNMMDNGEHIKVSRKPFKVDTHAIMEAIRENRDLFHKPFWDTGEIPELLKSVKPNKTHYSRVRGVIQWMHANGHGVEQDEIEAMCKNEQRGDVSNLSYAVLGFKYMLLKEAEKAEQVWTVELDGTIHKAALEIVRRARLRGDKL